MFDLDNLGGLAGEVLRDTRPVEDPWGFGIKAVVLRFDHPDWKKYDLDLAADKPVAEKIRRVTAEAAFSDMAPTGFRKTKKLSRGEAHQKMIRQLSAKDEVTTDIEDLREKKTGIASILCRSLSGIRKGGQELDLSTPEARLAIMDHAAYEFTEGGETKYRAIPVYKRGADGETELDQFEEPVEMRWGGWNTGDAIAAWLLEESKDLALFVETQKAVALEPSGATLTGSTATGSPESLQSAE
jgi:hypothetical protein